eukprot:scaffold422776_cov67-Attheya_sp.AAC.1
MKFSGCFLINISLTVAARAATRVPASMAAESMTTPCTTIPLTMGDSAIAGPVSVPADTAVTRTAAQKAVGIAATAAKF